MDTKEQQDYRVKEARPFSIRKGRCKLGAAFRPEKRIKEVVSESVSLRKTKLFSRCARN